jgi:isoleucyl-tRNA synthetase
LPFPLEEMELDYRETLNLPRTDFPMKADLPRREPVIQSRWKEMGLYKRILEKNRAGERFVLHDGPPYANGDIHLGTALNKILKDIVIRYRHMRGFYSPYVPGWDCHGQPIEHEVEKRLGGRKGYLEPMEIRKRCREYALHFVTRQAEQFQRLGVLGDFDNPYLTLDPAYEAVNIRILADLYRKGLVYRSRKPIHWCPRCVTALAEAELEYREKTSPSIYVKFPLQGSLEGFDGVSVVIWTTTPWTLPANVAIALHPDINYLLVEVNGSRLVVGEPHLEAVANDVGWEGYRVLRRLKGRELSGMKASHPWREEPSVVVLSEFVTMEQGTGAVHIAPGHGEEDYQIGLEYGLPMPMPVDDLGRFTEEAGPFQGLFIEEANPRIVDDLRGKGRLIHDGTVVHSYPHCWRCKGPVIFRATPQWFIAVDREFDGKTLRQRCLEQIEEVLWVPSWNINRMRGMLEQRPDWCISRQRAWGVPIPAFRCDRCGEVVMDDEILRRAEELIARKGSDAWFIRDEGEIIGEYTCPSCGSTKLRKETDILDVWFESGVSHEAVLSGREELDWPCDMYLEGSDQHRGWFQTSLLTAVAYRGRPPYRAVLTHGFVVDGEGRKMSKSLGNVIDPMDICQRLGADILRLWVSAADYTSDIPASQEILDRLVEAYRRIRNTVRFMLGNLHDFDPSRDSREPGELPELERWILSRLQGLVKRCTRAMEEFQLHIVFHSLHHFCAVDLSSLYLDIRKDCLYTFAPDDPERRSAQTALYRMLQTLLRLMAPILCHTAEEAWGYLPGVGEKDSVHLQDWPEPDPGLESPGLEEDFRLLLELREAAHKAMEEKRASKEINSSLEAVLHLRLPERYREIVEPRLHFLPTWFIVSGVEVEFHSGEEVEVRAKRSDGKKCPRCWNFRWDVGADGAFPELCARCAAVVRKVVGGDG